MMAAGSGTARREQLLDQLEEYVLAEGFEAMRVGALASRLRCSRSTLYKLAPSKEALAQLVFERFVERGIDMARDEAERLESPLDRIVRFSDVVGEGQARGSDRFWEDARNHPEISDVLSEVRARGYRIIQGYLDEGIASGVFRPANTAFIAHLVWIGARSARDPEVLRRVGMSTAEATRELGRMIAHGMTPEPSRPSDPGAKAPEPTEPR